VTAVGKTTKIAFK